MSTKADYEAEVARLEHAHETHLEQARVALALAVRQMDACYGELEHFRDGKRSKPEADDLMRAFDESRSHLRAADRAVARLSKAVALHDEAMPKDAPAPAEDERKR